jgi:hypothetical protein
MDGIDIGLCLPYVCERTGIGLFESYPKTLHITIYMKQMTNYVTINNTIYYLQEDIIQKTKRLIVSATCF